MKLLLFYLILLSLIFAITPHSTSAQDYGDSGDGYADNGQGYSDSGSGYGDSGQGYGDYHDSGGNYSDNGSSSNYGDNGNGYGDYGDGGGGYSDSGGNGYGDSGDGGYDGGYDGSDGGYDGGYDGSYGGNAAPKGTFDSANCTRLAGWACDLTTPTKGIDVGVYVGSTYIGKGTANSLRSGIGSQCNDGDYHGFSIPTSNFPVLVNGNTHSVYIRGIDTTTGSSYALQGNPRSLTCAAASPTPPPNSTPKGTLDVASCNQIAGWACDTTTPTQAITVRLYDGSTVLDEITANSERESAVGTACKNGNFHGFDVPTLNYPQLFDNASHSIQARGLDTTTNTSYPLVNSPRSIACAPPETIPPAIAINLVGLDQCYTPTQWSALQPIQATATDESGVADVFFRITNGTSDTGDRAGSLVGTNLWSRSITPTAYGTDFYLSARAVDIFGNASNYTQIGPFDYQAVCATPWVQTSGADVHSNNVINMPRGPIP
jgi:hypothetical protein